MPCGRSWSRSCATRLYAGPRMVKPPVVYTAWLLRRLGRGIDTSDWVWLDAMAGQQLFYLPNVAGWDDSRWLDTATFRGALAGRRAHAREGGAEREPPTPLAPRDPDGMLAWALALSGRLPVAPETRAAVLEICRRMLADAGEDGANSGRTR